MLFLLLITSYKKLMIFRVNQLFKLIAKVALKHMKVLHLKMFLDILEAGYL